MSTPNPLSCSLSSSDIPPPPISHKEFTIAGILTTVYGLSELPSSAKSITCLYLLHPRLQTHSCMAPIAHLAISSYNARRLQSSSRESPSLEDQAPGLLAISFDARNHGSRLVSPLANSSWRDGNPTHASDLFSCYQGTAVDTSLLIDHLPSYLFPDTNTQPSSPSITDNIVLGISLGGHAAWLLLVNEPRVRAGVVGIGCPDFERLMIDRARKSRREGCEDGNGNNWVGGRDYPRELQREVRANDPVGLLTGKEQSEDDSKQPDEAVPEREERDKMLRDSLGGKSILCLSGKEDKLVPYACSAPFLTYLKEKIEMESFWGAKDAVRLRDRVFDDVGHEMTGEMVNEAIEWIGDVVLDGRMEKDAKEGEEGSESNMNPVEPGEEGDQIQNSRI